MFYHVKFDDQPHPQLKGTGSQRSVILDFLNFCPLEAVLEYISAGQKFSDSLLCQEQFFSATDFVGHRDKDLCLSTARRYA